jgi:mono/diheme cytochrome c family protein/archaellum component FlaG (FlaF/FlaG flagellin family)
MKRSLQFFAPLAIVLVAVAAIWGVTRLTTVTTAHAHNDMVDGDTGKYAQIKVEEEIHDFGNIELNTFAEHTFFIKNSGNDTLTIVNTHASCGCTAAVMDNMKVAPGGISRLKVKFDAHNKGEGPITKTITVSSNSRTEADKVLRIKGTIVKSKTFHKTDAKADAMMHLEGVFQGDCAKCHVDKGRGELGARLYDADCAICHGSKVDGKPGPELASKDMMSHDKKSWTKVIKNGLKGTHMPAFHLSNKGPLNDEEIASIVDYLDAFKKNLARTQKTATQATPTVKSN